MTYTSMQPDGPRREKCVVDLPRFAADLAKALGATLLPAGDYPADSQQMRIGNDVLNVRANGYPMKGRVSVSITAPDVPHGDRNTYDKAHRTEDATINPNARSIESIAKDIRKRVIDASKEALAKQRTHAAELAAARGNVVKFADELKEAVPAMDIRLNQVDRRAVLYHSNPHVSATLYANGDVGIDRVGSISLAKFIKLVAVLTEGIKQ